MTEKSVYFPLVFHFHQPVDNFEHVYRECYEKSYRPLIKKIYEHPRIKVTLHFTGSLLRWLLDEHPEFEEMLKEMVARNQAEIIGGGFYEPIFAIIPERDGKEQIRKLTEFVKNRLGYTVKGAWLSERVWEPHYPKFLADAGLSYVILDDNHLRSCGLTEEDTFYTYTTEHAGSVIRIFPINEPIRYLAPWKAASETIEYLERNADEKGDRIIVFLSDAEKMGVWGTTHELCYVKGHKEDGGVPYIEALFSGIEKSKIIKPITLSEYIMLYPARGLIYIPTASYDKMEEWVLPTPLRREFSAIKKEISEKPEGLPARCSRFLKGGFWRYFLVKYPESNNMHKRMLLERGRLLRAIREMESAPKGLEIESLKGLVEKAWDEIYMAQCNDCYWHGQFGGVYLHFLRHAVYRHLIKAGKILDKLEQRMRLKAVMFIISIDFDKDSRRELVVSTDKLAFAVKPSDGGTLFELDFKPRSYNVLNVLTRWKEAYHDDDIVVDRWRKSALRDHIIAFDTDVDTFADEKYEELGDFVDGEYISSIDQSEDRLIIALERTGKIHTPSGTMMINLKKTISCCHEDTALRIHYSARPMPICDANTVSDPWAEAEKLYLAIDFPFILCGDPSTFRVYIDDEDGKFMERNTFNCRELVFSEEESEDGNGLTVKFRADGPSDSLEVFKYPIICYARTNNGFKELYEGMNTVLKVPLDVLMKKGFGFTFEMR